MRILALVTDAWGAGGGIAQYNRDLLGALVNCGVDVRVCCYTTSVTRDVPEGVEVPFQGRSRLAFSLSALRAAKDVDAVFCGHLHLVVPALIAARRARVPLWVQVHGVEAWHYPSRFRAWAIRRGDVFTSVSRYTRTALLSWLAVSPERVRVLPNTVAERFTPGEPPEDLRKRLGLAGHKVLLTVGRLAAGERYKGQDHVIEAMPRLKSKVGAVKYIIVGTGDDQPRLQDLCARLGVAPNVIFAGEISDDELPAYYRLADLFVMPSTGEGFGIAFLEAMACGVPAIGMALDGSRDPLSDPLGTTLKNLEELPRAIEDALNDAPLLRKSGKAATSFVRDNFTKRVSRLIEGLGSTDVRLT